MKINWGTGIALFYIVFVVALVFQVYKSTQYDNSLVSEKYYADDLAYQSHYDKLVNSQQLDQDLKIQKLAAEQQVQLHFPAEFSEIQGEIHFFCPSNSHIDFKVPIALNADNIQLVSTEALRAGLWRIKVDWQVADKGFYKEEVIQI
ncbi:MAG: FixH family protein [Bacteroidota bacterium]